MRSLRRSKTVMLKNLKKSPKLFRILLLLLHLSSQHARLIMSLLLHSTFHPNPSLRKTLALMKRSKLQLKLNRPTSYQFSILPWPHSQSYSRLLSSKGSSSLLMLHRAACTRFQRNGTSLPTFLGHHSFQFSHSMCSSRSRCPRSCSQSLLSTRLRCFSQLHNR